MAAITPRRSSRLPHTHTPKMSERKKSLFHSEVEASREALTRHRRLPVVNSESDSDDCDLGIISTLDSSSGDENHGAPRTPERNSWRGTRSSKLLKESNDLKNFIKSPFTLNKYQTRYCPDKNTGSVSTPVTPHMQHHPGTPSSSHSCTSVHTTSSTSSKARKSLASLIADTESCSSSLKDLNFDTDSGTDTKENTPTKSVRRSNRKQKLTPKFQSFKGILLEQKKNVTPPPLKTPVVCLTKMDMTSVLSPTQMLKTPNTSEVNMSPPKLGHNRRSVVEIAESPESCDSEKSHKRLRNNSMTEYGPVSKYPKLDTNSAPKARLSLFNSDKLKEILSAKSFYGKANPDLDTNITAKLSNAIEATNTHHRRLFTQSHSHKHKRRSGQINLGVRHRIRKPKALKNKFCAKSNTYMNKSDTAILNNSTASTISANNFSLNNVSMSQNSSQELDKDKTDPFVKEKQTIEDLLSQWTEEEVPESEIHKPELPCFNSTVIEETNQIFQPITAIPVPGQDMPQDGAVIIELGADTQKAPEIAQLPSADSAQDVLMTELHKASHGEVPNGQFLPVDGGFILVQDNAAAAPSQDELTDLDAIERELKMLDEQILMMTQAEEPEPADTVTEAVTANEKSSKLFPIFSNPNPGTSTLNPGTSTLNPGTSTPSSKAVSKGKKTILKDASDQYVIDAGQKRFGATQCTECGVIYQVGDPQDEHDHLVHHNATDVLRFNGWKEECVVGRWGAARCVRVRREEPHWRRVAALLARVVHAQLGCAARLPAALTYTAYLYIEKKQILGCAIVEPRTRAYKLIPGDPDCCTVEDYPVKCGVSRVWTHARARRRGVATRVLDCARATFLYGAALRTSDLAFSAPTPPGKALAAKYCGTDQFYVYLD